jgi:tRNA (cytidine32/uridine32-2'-O)-methyltransferase
MKHTPASNPRNATDPGPKSAEPSALAQVRIVLVETAHARNIGSVARAMKVMGLTRLVLVRPERFPHKDANDLAAGADDVLRDAVVVAQLADAVADCAAVYGASARRRLIAVPEFTPRQAAEHAMAIAGSTEHGMQNKLEFEVLPRQNTSAQRAPDIAPETAPEIAFVFGSEAAGLDNAALENCQYLLQVPANPAFASLNLAAAVQIVAYELRLASAGVIYQPRHVAAPAHEFEQMFQQLIAAAEQANYFGNKNAAITRSQLLRLFQRLQGSSPELKMLRGLLSQFQFKMRDKSA